MNAATTGSAVGRYLIGIDVGTGSARAGVFDLEGRLLAARTTPIALYRDAGGIVEQSSAEIWRAVRRSVRQAVTGADIEPEHVAGIGVDATCSLVVAAPDGGALPVRTGGDPERDIIVWMDHRATAQAERINATGHAVLRYVGGRMSPEMQTPKLLWLKEHARATYDAAGHFFDLADWLTWRATGDVARSLCTVTCKWTYLAHEERWDPDYFRSVGLEELIDDDFARIGTRVVGIGSPVGHGLTEAAARELDLVPGTPVSAGLIDAHAGGVGSVGAAGAAGTLATRMAYIFGTSACSMVSTPEPVFVDGVWGPYLGAMLPGSWLNEGGQSAAGAAIDHLVRMHPATAEASAEAEAEDTSLVAWVGERAAERCTDGADALALAGRVHVLPEFLGNRSPHADPDARALIAGLDLDDGIDALLGLYVAGLFGIAYGVRQLVEALGREGVAIDTLVLGGGAGRDDFVRQALSDASGLAVAVPETPEPVLLGGAIVAAVAGGVSPDIAAAMRAMSRFGPVFTPAGGAVADAHARRYAAFGSMQRLDRELREPD